MRVKLNDDISAFYDGVTHPEGSTLPCSADFARTVISRDMGVLLDGNEQPIAPEVAAEMLGLPPPAAVTEG